MDPNLALPGQGTSNNMNRIHETSAKFQRYKILLSRRWWFLLLTASIGVCIAALNIMNQPVNYTSLAKLVAGGRMVAQGDLNWQETMQDFYGTIIETLESADLKKRALTRIQALHPEMKDSEVEIRVSQTRGSAIFNVFAIGPEQKYTQIFLESLLEEFVNFRQQIREQGLERALNTFTETVVIKSKELEERGAKLEAFRKANNIVTLTNGNNEAAAFLINLKIKKKSLETELNDISLALQDVDQAMINRERGMTTGTQQGGAGSNPTAVDKSAPSVETAQNSLGLTSVERDYLETRKGILRLENERLKLLKSFKGQHPSVVQVDEQIESEKALLANFQEEIIKELRGQQADLERRIRGLDQQLIAQEKEAIELGSKLAQHERLEEEFRATKLAYDRMFERVQEFQQLQNVQTDFVAIQEHASLALKAEPKWVPPLSIGFILGLGLGILILLIFDHLDDRMNSFSEFQSLFPNEAVLGQVPDQRQRGDVQLLQPNDERHLYAEAFRNIRSSILFKNWQGKPPKTILVTSAVPNEGKTTVTSNLAVTLALGGARVLLADCDLRRGGVSELFKLPSSPGLTEVLRGSLHWRDAVQETSTRNLHLLARGEVFDQTSEMLLSKKAEEVLKEMGAEYDYVVFDSAPVLVADDTGSFAPKLDTVLFVVRMSSTIARLSSKALDSLYERQVNVGGVILNRASTSLKEYTYYNYASYYYTPVASKKSPVPVPPKSLS
ncbi:capsular exopolysaccharide synthesis family protein [Prosthecobacter fusiformis]|uniref:Capsular exopolysaccharide synthesis family protein n=1 Tax=Prosthecobacter fusiformis TaxID=48464 RepID=A0A4R7S376_9BACT|nr:polysaccharide biosynthesis tyrosine autokinase [Prosthecobacter fusiformis]TDU72842.1 capsular exopolysaccharide synthesis family protein [Prosthecobacter fusiformis]